MFRGIRQNSTGIAAWPWVFDAERAERPCYFIELLPHIKGEWAARGALITLEVFGDGLPRIEAIDLRGHAGRVTELA